MRYTIKVKVYLKECSHLVVEEVNGVFVEFEGEGLEEGDVVGQHLLVREVQLQDNHGVHVIVGEQVVCRGVLIHLSCWHHNYYHLKRNVKTAELVETIVDIVTVCVCKKDSKSVHSYNYMWLYLIFCSNTSLLYYSCNLLWWAGLSVYVATSTIADQATPTTE